MEKLKEQNGELKKISSSLQLLATKAANKMHKENKKRK
jgi:hypothetical protein